GCDWYIRRLLAAAGVELEVHSNPGRFEAGEGLLMEMPTGSPFLSLTLGGGKGRGVRWHPEQGRTVAVGGGGVPAAESARLVPGDLRFGRGDLADVLRNERLAFHPFDTWSDIARVLVTRGA